MNEKTIQWQWLCEKCGSPSFVGEIPKRNRESMCNFLVSWYKGLCPKCQASDLVELERRRLK